MINHKMCFALVAAMLPVGLSVVASGKAPGRQAAPARAAESRLFPPADYTLKVFSDSRLAEPQAKFHRQVRDRLNQARIGVPEDRVRYFQTVISPDSVRVGGWHGTISSIAPIENGILVELNVTAVQSGMADTVSLMERYSIINGEVHYIGAYVPKNASRFSVTF